MALYRVESLGPDDAVVWKETIRVKVGRGAKDAARGRVPMSLVRYLADRGRGRYTVAHVEPLTLTPRRRYAGHQSHLAVLAIDEHGTVSRERED